jgi:hypothetical protein
VIRDFILNVLASPEFITLVITTLGGFLAFAGKQVFALLSRRMSAADLKLLIDIATRAVLAAEQTCKGQPGCDKKAEALRVAQAFIVAYNMKVGAKQLDAAIEAAVLADLGHNPAPAVPDGPAAPEPEAPAE